MADALRKASSIRGTNRRVGLLGVYHGLFKGWKQHMAALEGTSLRIKAAPELQDTNASSSTSSLADEGEWDVYKLLGGTMFEASFKNIDHSIVLRFNDETELRLKASDRKTLNAWMVAFKQAMLGPETDGLHHHWYLETRGRVKCAVSGLPCGRRYAKCQGCHIAVQPGHVTDLTQPCKWRYDDDLPGGAALAEVMPHQWQRRFTSGRCDVCYQPLAGGPSYMCLYSKKHVHSMCRSHVPLECDLGQFRDAILAPNDITPSDYTHIDGLQLRVLSNPTSNHLIVFVNTRSGSNDGVRIMRMLQSLLNPAQVFDLNEGGPGPGLKLMQDRPQFRALGCGGDGTIGWILHELDKHGIRQCQVGVLPLGTGNDLARVLGWGGSYSSSKLSDMEDYIRAVQQARVKMMDRWSVYITPHEDVEELVDEDNDSESSRNSSRRSRLFRRTTTTTRKSLRNKAAKAVKGVYSRVLDAGSSLLDYIQELHPTTEGTASPARRLSHPMSRRSSIPMLLSPPKVERLVDMTQDLLQLVTSMHETMQTAATFSRDALSRVTVAKDRCARIASLLEAQFEEEEAHESDLPDVKVAVTMVLDACTYVMAALDREYARDKADQSEPGQETSVMNNYFGIGVDAKIAHDFDTLRNEHPEKCRSRMKNQMWYGLMGLRETFVSTCRRLDRKIKLEADGRVIPLPNIQGVVILNIESYMGGVNLWGFPRDEQFREQTFSDGYLEVLGVKGSAQMAMCKALPIHPIRLCQAHDIKITMLGSGTLPVQVDGEPWDQPRSVIHIRHKGRVQMLCRDKEFEGLVSSWNQRETNEQAEPLWAAIAQELTKLRTEVNDSSEDSASAQDRTVLKPLLDVELPTNVTEAIPKPGMTCFSSSGDQMVEAFQPELLRPFAADLRSALDAVHTRQGDLTPTTDNVVLYLRELAKLMLGYLDMPWENAPAAPSQPNSELDGSRSTDQDLSRMSLTQVDIDERLPIAEDEDDFDESAEAAGVAAIEVAANDKAPALEAVHVNGNGTGRTLLQLEADTEGLLSKAASADEAQQLLEQLGLTPAALKLLSSYSGEDIYNMSDRGELDEMLGQEHSADLDKLKRHMDVTEVLV